jgi:hypothetical protein
MQEMIRKQKIETTLKTGEAKAIAAGTDTLFKYFDKLKDLIPELKDNAEGQGSENEKDVKEMLLLLGFVYKK